MWNLNRLFIITTIFLVIFNGVFLLIYFNYNREPRILVGAFYYVWYGENRHWNDNPSNIVVDSPATEYYSGYYSSLNETIIFYQLKLIKDCGIDVLIISWTSKNSFEDNATKIVFKILKEHNIKLKVAIMVEPIDDYDINMTKLNNLKNYILESYVYAYNEQYFYWNDKPLIGFFVPLNPPDDDLFSFRVIGEQPYSDWPYWNVPPKISKEGVVAILPRYDDSRLPRDIKIIIDPFYMEKVYDEQWNFILENKDKISLVLITSWNEYHERTMIEPHYDATAKIDNYHPYYLYEKTKTYIQQLKRNKFFMPTILPFVILQIFMFTFYQYIQSSRDHSKEHNIKEVITLGIFNRIIVIFIAFLANLFFGLRVPFEGEILPNYEVPLLNLFSRWDSGYYLNIAIYGYSELIQWAFRPLFPIVLRCLYSMLIRSEAPTSIELIIIGFILNNVLFIALIILFYKLSEKFFDKDTAFLLTFLYMIYPTSFIFSAIYPESLFYLLILSGFILLEKKHILKSSLLIFLAGLTRPEGFTIFIIYIVMAILEKKNISKYIIGSFLSFLSFICFLLYSLWRTGSIFTPIQAELLWSRKGMIDMIRDFRSLQWNFNPGVSLIYLIINLPIFIIILCLLFYYYVKPIISIEYNKELFRHIFPYVFHSTVYFSIITLSVDYISFARLSLFLFPIFWIIGILKNKYLIHSLIFANTSLLMLYLSLYVNWYHIT
jgi:Gpi18-like mannosyltransferase